MIGDRRLSRTAEGMKTTRSAHAVCSHLPHLAGEWHFAGGAKRQADRGPLQTACPYEEGASMYEEPGHTASPHAFPIWQACREFYEEFLPGHVTELMRRSGATAGLLHPTMHHYDIAIM